MKVSATILEDKEGFTAAARTGKNDRLLLKLNLAEYGSTLDVSSKLSNSRMATFVEDLTLSGSVACVRPCGWYFENRSSLRRDA
jgi:hypothetical protein